MKRLYQYLLPVLVMLLSCSVSSSYACTVFYICKDGKVMGGSNEDWKDPNTMMWFYPATEENHAWVKFGFKSGFPQAGMNDSGIFWDATSNPWQGMPYAEEHKELYAGALMQKVMEECNDIPEVIDIFDNFYCQDQYRGQYLIGGSEEKSLIVDGDYYHHNEGSYQVLTNFHQSNPELGGYPCWRYTEAVDMLDNCSGLTEYFIGSVLSATHQDGKYPTQYSLIFDPVERQIYLFYFHNFEEYLLLDLDDISSSDSSSYAIPPLFSRFKMISPAHGEVIHADSVMLEWFGLPGSTYHITLADDTDRVLLDKSLANRLKNSKGGKLLYLAAFMLPVVLMLRRRKVKSFILILVCFVLFLSCKKEDEVIPVDPRVMFTEIIRELSPSTEYTWKLTMEASGDSPFQTESVEFKFSTAATLNGGN